MLRTVNDQPTLWDSILPAEALVMSSELTRVDALLDDPVFFAPFAAFFDPRHGRPSIPMETYLRLMFLRFRYRLGYEALCREVTDSISWQRFARIPLGTRVPHPTTLMKITTKCGDTTVAALNDALLAKAATAKLLRVNKVRADTTVAPAAVAYRTDSGLLAKAVGQIARTVNRVKAAGGATRTRSRDRRRAAGRRARAIAGKLKLRGAQQRDEAQATVQRITGELADLAQTAMAEAAAVIRNGKRACRHATGQRKGQLRRALAELDTILERAARVIAQTRSRLGGVMPESSIRLVSLHDPDARPIRKGRLGIPVEFGYKAQLVDNEDGVILDHNVEIGNPADAPQLAPAIERITRRAGRTPRAVTADRGYGEAKVENDLHELGVRVVAIPRKSKPSAARREIEHRRAFREKVKWRTGSEGRINHIKTQLRLEPHRTHRHRRRPNLVRTRRIRPQPGQDRSPRGLKPARHRTALKIDRTDPRTQRPPNSPLRRPTVFQGEVASGPGFTASVACARTAVEAGFRRRCQQRIRCAPPRHAERP